MPQPRRSVAHSCGNGYIMVQLLKNGVRITEDLCNKLLDQELAQAKQSVDPTRYQVYEQAASLMRSLIHAPRFVDFLTLPAYQQIVETEGITA